MDFGGFGMGGGFGGFGGGGFGMGGGGGAFEEQYHCYSMAVIGRAHLEQGDKVLLPPSALDTLARLNVDWPMLFQVTNTASGKSTHCGVLEFSAEEGKVHLPYWVMQNLLAGEGSMLTIKNVSLPKATFVKFKPQHVDFLEISDPRAVLEYTLRSYSCLSVGDHICVPYNDKNYYLEVKELQPADAASIIETDCNVDFEAPVGYVEPQRTMPDAAAGGAAGGAGLPIPAPQSGRAAPPEPEPEPAFTAFGGSGARLDGKPSPKPKGSSDDGASDSGAGTAGGQRLGGAPASGAGSATPSKSASASAGGIGSGGGAPAPAGKPRPRYMGRGGRGGASKWASKKPTARAFAGQGRSLGGK